MSYDAQRFQQILDAARNRTAQELGLPVWDARSGNLDRISLLPGAERAMGDVARPSATAPLWSNRVGAGYEVSSQGDRRFSALYARLPDGRTIEDAWGQAKGYADGRAAKGRPARNPDFDYWGTYKGLWQQWADANPALIDELASASAGKPLVDRFAKTDNNQARALAEILMERQAPPAAARAFEIVSSRGKFDVLGMRQKGQTMATVKAPGEPGWLGNPYVADDAGGSLTRQQATEKFGELIEEKAKDAAWRDAFLALEGKRIGYYKPEEEFIHLQPLSDWITRNRGESIEPPTAAEQLDLFGGLPPDGMRFAGQAWPWIAGAGGAAAMAYAVAELNAARPAPQIPEEEWPAVR